MMKSVVRGSILIVGILGYASPLLAGHLFPAGSESKSIGMESTLRSEGAPSILYNPANLNLSYDKSPVDPYFELGIINVNYYYEHPQFDPVYVQVTSPIATIGYTHHFGKSFSAGAVIFPTESGETTIPGLPRRLGANVQALNIYNKSDVTDVGVGLTYQPHKMISLGASLVRTMEDHQTTANAIDNDNSLIDIEYKNNFDRWVLGTRFDPMRELSVALSARPAQTKEYEGAQTDLGATADPKVVNYEPRTIGLGFGGWAGPVEWGVEANQQQWSEGATVVKDGINAFAPDADLKDVIHSSVSAGIKLGKAAKARLSVADLPSPWGEGNNSEEADEQVHGVDYGALNAIDRRVIASGGSVSMGAFDIDLAAYYSQGTRKVSAEGSSEGYYSLDIFSLSGSVKTEF